MTLINESGLDVSKTYLHTKNAVSRSMLSKVKSPNGTNTHTDKCDRTLPCHTDVLCVVTTVTLSVYQ